MKRVIIVHGWEGSPETNWLPWLERELAKQGCDVITPAMPETDTPRIDAWVEYLREVVGTPDKETYFVGHSIGCQTILRYLETVQTPVGGALFVAGWFYLENIEDEGSEEIAQPWLNTPIDVKKVKQVLPQSILLISDNDDYGAFEENKKKFGELGSDIVVLPKAGHITDKEEPAILEQFTHLVK